VCACVYTNKYFLPQAFSFRRAAERGSVCTCVCVYVDTYFLPRAQSFTGAAGGNIVCVCVCVCVDLSEEPLEEIFRVWVCVFVCRSF